MPIIPLPPSSVVRIQVWSTLAGQAIINHWDYRVISVPIQGTDYNEYMTSLANHFGGPTGLLKFVRDCYPNNLVVNLLRLQPIHPQRLRFVDFPMDLNGSGSGPAQTANVAASLERWARTGGRKAIGRISIPIPGAVYDQGIIIDDPFLIKWDILATEMLDPITTIAPSASYEPVILNPIDPNTVPRPIEGAVGKRTVRVQRRRTVGLGI